MPCLICSIIEGRITAEKVYEDEHCLAFLDIRPAAPGHTMLVPKTHVSRIEDLTPEQAQALFSALHRILTPIRDAVGADATTVGVNNGPGVDRRCHTSTYTFSLAGGETTVASSSSSGPEVRATSQRPRRGSGRG